MMVNEIVVTNKKLRKIFVNLVHSVLKSINVKYESNNVIIEAEQNFDIIKSAVFVFLQVQGPARNLHLSPEFSVSPFNVL
jgi:hypothetical protein